MNNLTRVFVFYKTPSNVENEDPPSKSLENGSKRLLAKEDLFSLSCFQTLEGEWQRSIRSWKITIHSTLSVKPGTPPPRPNRPEQRNLLTTKIRQKRSAWFVQIFGSKIHDFFQTFFQTIISFSSLTIIKYSQLSHSDALLVSDHFVSTKGGRFRKS